MLIKDK